MGSTVGEIVKATVKKMTTEGVMMTPDEYAKVFCQEAKKAGFIVEDCQKLLKLIEKLDPQTQAELKKYSVRTVDELVIFLASRLKAKGGASPVTSVPKHDCGEVACEDLAKLIADALTPSITHTLELERDEYKQKLLADPKLLTSQTMHKELQQFITKRVVFDRQEVRNEMSVIDAMVDLISQKIAGAVSMHAGTHATLGSLKEHMTHFDFRKMQDQTYFDAVHGKLGFILDTLYNQSHELSAHLTQNQDEVTRLQNKISELETKLAKVEDESLHDPLSKLLNRRGWDTEIGKLESRYLRFNEDYIIAVFDLDKFKDTNDTYGHDAGDIVLKTFGHIMAKELRVHDVAARLGGEEFAAALPLTGLEGGITAADKLRQAIEKTHFMYRGTRIPVTASGGVVYRSAYNSVAEAMKACDERLYKAKHNGRNRIES